MATVKYTVCDRCEAKSTQENVKISMFNFDQKTLGDDHAAYLCGCSSSHIVDTLRHVEEHMETKIRIIQPNGEETEAPRPTLLVGKSYTDMFVDENGLLTNQPRNEKATEIYRNNWLTQHPGCIVGTASVVLIDIWNHSCHTRVGGTLHEHERAAV